MILAAADTFRAAAIDQLRIWADRAHVPVVAHAPGADPGAVVYDAIDAAVARGADLVIADTAGRLHTKVNLMDELTKIRRDHRQAPAGRPARDALRARRHHRPERPRPGVAFHEAVGLTGIVLTKLDSTAKGGIVFAIEDSLKIPVRFVGVGEKVGDLLPFDPDALRGGALRLGRGCAAGSTARRRGVRTVQALSGTIVPAATRKALRYTAHASVRQNPRTTRIGQAPWGDRPPTRITTTRGVPTRTMFDTLSERLRKTLGTLTGRGRISEADVDAAMREVRLALLEADVNFKVVKDFVGRVREKAIGADVLASLTAGQQVVKIVNDELVELLSAGDRTFHLSGNPAVVAMVGPAGLGQDDVDRQARPPHREARSPAAPRRRGPLPSRGRGPARDAGQEPRHPGLPSSARHERAGHRPPGRRGGQAPGARRRHPRHRRPAHHRRRR